MEASKLPVFCAMAMDQLNDPPAAVPPLVRLVRDAILRDGPLPFSRFMELALYHPQHGYYSRPPGQVGRGGDFFTSVSVGACFGQLVADHCLAVWREMGKPDPFYLVEQGAHDGRLAADVLARLDEVEPGGPFRCHLVEPRPALRTAQAATLEKWLPRVSWSDEPPTSPLPAGLFFANELLDAFPVLRARFSGTAWQELHVGLTPEGAFADAPLDFSDPEAAAHFAALGTDYPAGYTTEFCPALRPWFQAAAQCLARGEWLLFDYGRPAADYYAPHRTGGTLRGYRRHQRQDDPFLHPGETDLTADVDFTRATACAAAAGLQPAGLTSQEAFLIRAATPRLQAMEAAGPAPGDAAWLRQFQTLTHPAHLGRSFHALRFRK